MPKDRFPGDATGEAGHLGPPSAGNADNGAVAPALHGRRILYLTHRLPYPPAGGARVRAYHAIRWLAAHNRVTVAAPVRGPDEAAAAKSLSRLCHRVLTGPIGRNRALAQCCWQAGIGRPASVGYFDVPALRRRIRTLLVAEPFDLIVVHCSAVAPYVADAQGIPKILDMVDVDSRKWHDYSRVTSPPRSLVYAREGRTLENLERRMAGRFDLVITATDHEADTLRALAGDVPQAVVRNGVDLDEFHPIDDAYDPDRICFIGRMDYFPNEQAVTAFCAEVWPRIRQRRPRANFLIVGAEPTAAIRSLARTPGVQVTGSVADVRPFVWRAAATVAPLRLARGTQNKILESMAMGVPVVASRLAARGVDAVADRHLLVGDDPAEMAEQILRLLDDPAERDRFARAGRELVEARYAWATTLRDLDAALTRCLTDVQPE